MALLYLGLPACDEPAPGSVETEAVEAEPAAIAQVETTPRTIQPFTREELEEALAMKDASRDKAWTTEAFQDEVTPSLARLAVAIQRPEKLGASLLRHIALPDISCTPLRPRDLAALKAGDDVQVYEGTIVEEAQTGLQVLVKELGELGKIFAGQGEPKLKFKIVRIEPLQDGLIRTRVWVQSYGPQPRHFDAHWICTWKQATTPWLQSIELERHSEVERGGTTLFADCTNDVLGGNESLETVLRPGLSHWLARLDLSLGNHLFGHHGLAVADVNSDGYDDVYVCLNGGLPNQLFLQDPDGTATEHGATSGLDLLDYTRSALFVDFDGDGDQDVAIGSVNLLFFENDGEGHFTLRAKVADNKSIYSLAAADYDADGDLDLYVCRYVTGDKHVPDPYHDAHNGPPNSMFRNNGGWGFEDVTAAIGLDDGNDRFSFSASWVDYDNDADLDLYVANDFGRNNLYQYGNGRFRDVAAEAGVEDISAGMSAAWGDANNDGAPDLYVSNMFSSAGNRVSYQRNFQSSGDVATRELFQRHARGNSLFENAGDGTFRDVSVERGVTLGRWAWSSLFADADNDGNEDLFVTNGFVTNDFADDL